MFHLLDTNIIGELVRNPRGPAAMILAERSDMDIATSVIVEGELRFGCRKKGSDRLTARVEALLAEIEILDPTLIPKRHGNTGGPAPFWRHVDK